MEEKSYRYWLCKTPGLGAVKIRSLIEIYGSAEAVFYTTEEQLQKALEDINGKAKKEQRKSFMNEKDVNCLLEHRFCLETCNHEYEHLKDTGTLFLVPGEDAFPERLYTLEDCPQGIFIRGNLPEAVNPTVAIVGARRCSSYGQEISFYLGKKFAMRGVTVVSGMAEGIDGAAHRGAIEGVCEVRNHRSSMPGDSYGYGSTIAILGSGVDRCYPRVNMDIYKELQEQDPNRNCGGILSEFPLGTTPYAGNFPMRNRLISAMADAVIVVEAKLKSGSLITADQALEQGKDVYVIPGRITDPLSKGCNNLILQGASIVTDLDEFIDELCPETLTATTESCKNKKNLAIHEEMVYSCLDFIPKHMAEIMEETGLDINLLLLALYNLQNLGLVKECSKNSYALKLT